MPAPEATRPGRPYLAVDPRDLDEDDEEPVPEIPEGLVWPQQDRWNRTIRKGRSGAQRPPYIDAESWCRVSKKKRREAYLEYRDELIAKAKREAAAKERAAATGAAALRC